jgi:uncharacterized membrane protein
MRILRHAKNLTIFVLAIVAMLWTAAAVSAAPDYMIDNIRVNDLSMINTGSPITLDVERGDRLDIEVYITGTGNDSETDDVFVTAKIMGYEFGSVSESEGPFSIESGKTYKKTLTLYVPEDIDSSEEYTLRLEVSDRIDEISEDILLHIDESRHNLRIYDVVVNPSSTIAAGNPLFVTVRLENLGEKEENDIKVKATIPALGVSTINYLGELNTENQEENEDHLRQDSSKQLDLLVRIPEDAATGVYELKVEVEYNRGHNFLSQSMDLNVEGFEAEVPGVQTVINTDSNSKETDVGETVEYRVMIANIGEQPGVFSVQIDGVSTWGEAVVQPGLMTVMPDSTGEVVISITPFNADDSSTHTWVARVMLENNVLSESLFTTKVNAQEVEKDTTSNTLKTVLAIVFGILIVVLIVLALIIAFRKATGNEEESAAIGEQTYY